MRREYKYDVFLSHSSDDKSLVRKLAALLKERGLRVWFDEWNIKPGDDIWYQVERGLGDSYALILCMTPSTFGSDWVTLERNTRLFLDPLNKDRRFIPLLMKSCKVPSTIQRYKYINGKKIDARLAREILECIPRKVGDPSEEKEKELGDIKRKIGKTLKTVTVEKERGKSAGRHLAKKKKIFKTIDEMGQRFHKEYTPASLLFIDLDGFTLMNRKHGRVAGNEIIRVVLSISKSILPDHYVVRWGADEFIGCLSNTSEEKALELSKKLLYCIENYSWEEITPSLFVTVSIGVASFKRKAIEKTVDWMERAIIGSIFAKKAGGNTVKRGPVVPNPPVLIRKTRPSRTSEPVEYLSDSYGY